MPIKSEKKHNNNVCKAQKKPEKKGVNTMEAIFIFMFPDNNKLMQLLRLSLRVNPTQFIFLH